MNDEDRVSVSISKRAVRLGGALVAGVALLAICVLAVGLDARPAAAQAALRAPDLLGVQAVNGSTTEAELTFIDKSEGETAYELISKRPSPRVAGAIETGLFQSPGGVAGTQNVATRVMQFLQPGARYCFVVRAVNLAVNPPFGPSSNEVCYTMPSAAPAPAATPGSEIGFPVLAVGMSGEAVTSLQLLLRAQGFPIAVDGDFGGETFSFVLAFQNSRGIGPNIGDPPPGVVGERTWIALVPTLGTGAQGDAVLAVQRQLFTRGFDIALDGDFGPQTRQVVLAYQRSRNLIAGGVVDQAIWRALLSGR